MVKWTRLTLCSSLANHDRRLRCPTQLRRLPCQPEVVTTLTEEEEEATVDVEEAFEDTNTTTEIAILARMDQRDPPSFASRVINRDTKLTIVLRKRMRKESSKETTTTTKTVLPSVVSQAHSASLPSSRTTSMLILQHQNT